MRNNIMILNHDKCTGCGICEVVCPKSSIKIIEAGEGFYNPKLNEDTCINCGICIKTCIKFNEIKITSKHEKVYSAKNIDKSTLRNSTSGGVSNELMKKAILEGYKIVGVKYDYSKNKAVNSICDKLSDLGQYYGSKYMESYTIDALKEIINDKSEQKYAIFSTPCQVYSLHKYSVLNNQRDRFLFIDLFCHGCPSIKVWEKYLEMNKRRFNHSSFDKIEFRSKVRGWHEYSFLFEKNRENFVSSKLKNEFNDLFFNLDCLNLACYECGIRSTLEYTDIRLGDFWGSQYDDDIEGVSAVIIASKKGEVFFDGIKQKLYLKTHELKEVLPGQSYGKIHVLRKNKRNLLLNMLKSDMKIEEIHRKYISLFSLKKKIKINLIKILKLLPQKTFIKLRKLSHIKN